MCDVVCWHEGAREVLAIQINTAVAIATREMRFNIALVV